jgi:hypothetical protein
MPFLSQLTAALLLIGLTTDGWATEPAQRGIAAPFGVPVGNTGSCDALHKRFGSPSVKRLSEADPSNIAFEAKVPDSLFPNAKSITVLCNGGLVWSVNLIVNRSRTSDQELTDVLKGLAEKYDGDAEVDSEGYGFFKSRNARIEVVAKPNRNWFLVSYTYRAESSQESDASDKPADKSRQRRNAL